MEKDLASFLFDNKNFLSKRFPKEEEENGEHFLYNLHELTL